MAEAQAVINSTAKKYFAGAADSTIRKRLLLALLNKHGRISFGATGYDCTWLVEFAQPPVQSHGASSEYEFSEHDVYRSLNIDWRGYVATDKMDEKNRLMNSDPVAMVNRYKRIIPNLRKSLDDHFHGELYIDGNQTGNENRLHGMLSFAGNTTTISADLVAQPDDTYAGKVTNLGNQGGSWSSDLSTSPNNGVATDWPDGNGTPEYDYITPVLVNTTSSNWGTGSTDWEVNCGRILRRTTTWLTKNGGTDGRPTVYMMANDLFNSYQDYQESRFRNIIPHTEARELGFPDALNQDGVMVKYEFDVKASEFWGVNVHQMQLESLDDVLFGVRGPHYDIKSDATLFKAGFFGNMRFNPKYFAFGKGYA